MLHPHLCSFLFVNALLAVLFGVFKLHYMETGPHILIVLLLMYDMHLALLRGRWVNRRSSNGIKTSSELFHWFILGIPECLHAYQLYLRPVNHHIPFETHGCQIYCMVWTLETNIHPTFIKLLNFPQNKNTAAAFLDIALACLSPKLDNICLQA